MTRFYTILVLLCLIAGAGQAQSLAKQAERQYDRLSFAKAAELYEQLLSKPAGLSDAERRTAMSQLAYSYRQLRDMKNAERVYAQLLSEGQLPAELAPHYLYYAQALASNGKYTDAQTAYNRYNQLNRAGTSGPTFAELYAESNARTMGKYAIEFLKMNTKQPEFSPVRYRDGLVFVSAGRGGRKSGGRNPFLDLYYLPESSITQSGRAGKLGGGGSESLFNRSLGRDKYTAVTANDSRTVGFYGGTNITAGLGYGDVLVSESERFANSLNTRYHEGPATFSHDGSRIIFTRNNYNEGTYRKSTDGVNKLKLYTATQTNGEWSKAVELPFNNDEFSTGHPTLSADDQRLYFASDRPGGFGGTDIYVAFWKDGAWSEPVNLGSEINSKGNEMFPFIDERGTLYVSSDGHGGLGKLDLFSAQLTADGAKALSLTNLGEPINSPADDFGIVTDGERKSGYFSSNRKNGGADDDIYSFKRESPVYPCRELTLIVIDADTKAPLPGAAVVIEGAGKTDARQLTTNDKGQLRFCLDDNSDVQFLTTLAGYLDNRVGFSTKALVDNQPLRLDISMMKPQPSTELAIQGRVLAQADRSPIEGARVILVNGCDQSRQETMSAADGSYAFSALKGCSYTLEARKASMGNAGSTISREGVGNTELLMFRQGDVIRIDNIYYDRNKANIRPDAAVELDKLVDLLGKYPAMRIEMRSHTDSRATASYNRTLSDKRARAVVAYLKSKGIAGKRMIAKGYGESELTNRCADGVDCTEEEHQQNRRTEIKILKLE